jgi:hypothetical protein
MKPAVSTKERKHVFSAPLSETDLAMLKRVSEAEDIPMANLFRRWVRSEFERRFPGEHA